jgi:hypothetical protein
MTGGSAILCLNLGDVAITVNQCEPCPHVTISGLSRVVLGFFRTGAAALAPANIPHGTRKD